MVLTSDGNRTVPSREVPGRSRDGTGRDRTGPRDLEGPVVLAGQELETLKVPGPLEKVPGPLAPFFPLEYHKTAGIIGLVICECLIVLEETSACSSRKLLQLKQ